MKKTFSLPKIKRLGANREFQKVYKEGKSTAGRYLVFHWLKKDEPVSQIGFAAGKKLGNAVVRNRLKMIMREAWRLYPKELPENYDFLLVARKSLVGKGYQEAERGLIEVLTKSGFLVNK